ncbi:hypothetical protein WJ96_13125 [Burkholderia ubonensis]|uniref:Carrier domain-containing protein n=1 Tax=Burkholderia ubonensis TaxID=101571 RepID=A0AAW3MQA5_9BURK|nr:non-ribosomal peptide synthetase [Burkholderia ubonensis]KVP94093.1 hypothetical protein WJ96_13125 [Burkholderia ubonensis]KVZ89024.1 hypothetical protein WL25_23680 [Burkholderia ubonensis]
MAAPRNRSGAARANVFHCLRDGEAVAASCRYDELDDAVRDAASFLYHGCGVREGARVMLALRDPLRFATAFLACQFIGAVPVGLSPNLNRHSVGDRLSAIAHDTRAVLLLTDATYVSHAAVVAARERTGIATAGIGERFETGYPSVARVDSPIAFVQYTSGSTHEPKGAAVSRAALDAQLDLLIRTFGFDARSTFVNWLPLHHDMGLVSKLLLPYHLGATSVHMLPAAFVQRPARWLRAIERFRGTVSSAPNFAYELCLHIPDDELAGLDLSSWSSAVCGAEAVREKTLSAFATRFAAHGFDAQALCPAYGMAETTLLVTARRGVAHDAPRVYEEVADLASLGALASCGEPVERGLTVKIVDAATRTECAHGEIGEIWVAGPSVADGYVRDGGLDRTAFAHVLATDGGERYLATGDLGYVGPAGLHVLGRVGSALTVAGRKYFFSDIEFAMTQLDARFAPNSAAAFSVDGGRSVTLVCQLRGGAITDDALAPLAERSAAAIEATFPVAVSTVSFTARPLPRTSSGKLQRDRVRALCEAGRLPGVSIHRGRAARGADADSGAADGETIRARVLGAIARELGVAVDRVDVERTLAELGAESLAIVRIQFELERRFDCSLDRAAMYASLSVRALIDAAAASKSTQASPIDPSPAVPADVAAPSTHYQRALHFAETLAGRPIYTLHRAVRINGALDVGVLERVLRVLETRHDALRGTLRTEEHGLAYVVDPIVAPSLVVEDRHGVAAEADEVLRAWIARGIPSDAARLYRTVVLRLADDASILLLQIHHAIADFWSLVIIWRELFDVYESLACGEGLQDAGAGADYAGYCSAHRSYLASGRARDDAAFWRAALSPDCDPRLPLLTHGLDSYDAAQVRCALPAVLVRAVHAAASRMGTTVNCVMQLALQASLAAVTRRARVRYGIALLNRTAQYRDTVGMFANLVPIESELAVDAGIDGALAAVRDRLAAALAHEASPISQLGADAAATGSTPGTCFDVVYAYFDLAGVAAGRGGVEITLERDDAVIPVAGLEVAPHVLPPSHVHYPLQMQVFAHENRLDLRIEYRRDAFDALLVSSWLEQFRFALSIVAAGAGRTLGEALAMPPETTSRLLDWGVEPGAAPASTLSRIVRIAMSEPDGIALVAAGQGEAWTYGRLLAVAAEFARHVRRADSHGRQPVVAVMLPRSPVGVAACVGVLLAGGIYLPIDPAAPAARRDYMLQDSGAAIVIASRLLWPDGITLPVIDADACAAHSPPWDPTVCVDTDPDCAAYLMYTSGSTGRPKGVLVAHRALDSRIDWMIDRLALGRDDVFVQKTIWTFDVSLWEILAPLALGAKAVCVEAGRERFPEAVAAAIVAHGVTVAHFVPSVMMHWLGIDPVRDALRRLRVAVCSGERMLVAQAQAFFACAPNARLFNFYGPTEAGIDVTYAELDPRAPGVAIGRPAPRCEAAIVDTRGVPVLPGVAGELVVGGPQVAIGYVGQPALTAAHFVPSPLGTGSRCYRTGDIARFDASGAIVYLGRRDGQVKFAGYRIETGEIEHALASLPGVRDVVVMLVEGDSAPRLCAFLCIDGDAPPSQRDALEHARRWLPEFMVPHEWRMTMRFPLLESGKADRAALRAQLAGNGRDRDAGVAGDLRARLATHWRAVLGGAGPADDDDFFDAGGDSILALQFIGRLRDDGIALSVPTLFRHGGFGALCACLAQADGRVSPVESLAPFALVGERDRARLAIGGIEDAYPLSYLQRGILYKYFNDDHYEVFVTSIELVARWDAAAMRCAIDHVVAEHAFLRTSIDVEHYDEPLQIVHRTVEAPLVVHDLTGLPDPLRRARLDAWIDSEKSRAFAWDVPLHCRCTVHLLDAERFQLTFADASLDGWCVATVLTDLLRAYSACLAGGAPPASPGPALSYAEFVALERQALASDVQRRFWAQALAAGGFDAVRPAMHVPHAPHSRLLWCGDEALVGRLERVARAAGVPLKSALMAVHFAALAADSGAFRQTSGVEFNGRPEMAGGERCVGVFNNMLPISLDLAGLDWLQAMRTCFDVERECLPCRRFPYAELVAMNGGRPLFDTLFVYTHFHVYRALDATPLSVVSHYASDQTYVPLTVHFNRSHAGEGFQILFDYDARCVDIAQVERLRATIATMLAALGASRACDAVLASTAVPSSTRHSIIS